MNKPFLFYLLIINVLCANLNAQKFTISGFVTDAKTGESLIGTNVFVKKPIRGATTNTYGFYTITLDKGNYELYSSFLGYTEWSQEIVLDRNLTLNIRMLPSAITTQEVVVTADRPDENIQSTAMGTFDMPVEMVKKLPAIFGEVDILKTLQLKPGIQSGGEGTTGLYVRGGGPDQNLILLDEAVVYNASHLFGFFSVFNADAIQNVKVYKGNMPANYGGRLSSVLDISMKEGNNKKYGAQGGLGLISSRLTVEGPIKKDTSSFIISGRRTYVDVVMKPFLNKNSPMRESAYYFYDLNAKVNYIISDKNRIFISSYFGRDVFDLNNSQENFSNSIEWGNATAVFRWNHLYNHKLFSNKSIIYTNYNFQFDAIQDQYQIKLKSGIEDWNAKIDYTWIPSTTHTVKFGLNYIYHQFTPYNMTVETAGVGLDMGPPTTLYSHESAAYINNEFDLSTRLKIKAGLRYSNFVHVGPFDRFLQDSITGMHIDTIRYSKGQIVKPYHNVEPRIGARYLLNEFSSLKAAFTQNYQYIHLVSMSSVSLPTDIWVPSTDLVKPQLGRQYSLGYFRNFHKNMFEASVEVYYKNMENQIEFKEAALPEQSIANNTDNNFTFGDGESYGIELYLNKKYGKFTGWLGYTWSKTTRQFPEINRGEVFPAKFDRRHDVSFVLMYELNENLNFGLVWVYATGNTATLPIARYNIGGHIINEYGVRNSFRMPPYHRMDLSVNWFPKQKKPRKWQSSWNFSIYNLYNRRNPYYIYFESVGNISDGHMEIKAKQVSLFPILPSVTYNFKF